MGEYARRKSDGQEIKIGTCEDMYYLRADQRFQVSPLPGNLDPASKSVVHVLRFRFPWPHEDGTQPGEFEEYEKAVAVHGVSAPAGVEHHSVQFAAHAGYLVSLPCPEGPSSHGLTIHRNGFKGAVLLTQQKLLADGRLVPICRCGGCGSAWRVEDPADIEAIAVAFRAEGDRLERAGQFNGTGKADRVWWDKVADRVLAGAGLVAV
jgi:hypothetical protein